MKKRDYFIIFVLICLIMFNVSLGVYFHFKDNEVKNANVKLVLKDNLNASFLSEVKVSDFIEEINGKIIDDYVIDTNVLGEKKISFKFINDEGIKVSKEFTIDVIDDVAPVVWLGSSYNVTVNSDVDLTDKILCGDNYDKKPKCEIIGEYDISKVGEYPLTFRATDSSGNETIIDFTLNVNSPSKSNNNSSSKTKVKFSDVISKYKNDNTEIGIDISEWQDYPDFEKLKKAGVEFAFLRVGGTKLKTGEYFLDKSFKYNVENASKAGIPVGVYFYSYAKSSEQALEDAKWIYEQIKDYKIDLGIAYDWENWSFYNSFNLSFYDLTEMANIHLNYFKEKGYNTYLYSSKSYLEEIWLKSDHTVWLAHYTKDIQQSSYEGEYTYWQLCSNGQVDGINGDVDFNIRFKN